MVALYFLGLGGSINRLKEAKGGEKELLEDHEDDKDRRVEIGDFFAQSVQDRSRASRATITLVYLVARQFVLSIFP